MTERAHVISRRDPIKTPFDIYVWFCVTRAHPSVLSGPQRRRTPQWFACANSLVPVFVKKNVPDGLDPNGLRR